MNWPKELMDTASDGDASVLDKEKRTATNPRLPLLDVLATAVQVRQF